MVLLGHSLSLASQHLHPTTPPTLPLPYSKTSCADVRFSKQIHARLIITGAIHHAASLYLSAPPESSGLAHARLLFGIARHPPAAPALCNALIRGLVNHNLPFLALRSYLEILQEWDFSPDRFTFPSLLKACGQSMASFEGRTIHGQVLRCGLAGDVYVQATLISMYAACGDLQSATAVFNGTSGGRNQVIWDSMISGLVKNNSPQDALRLFSEMSETEIEADEITLTSVISACAELKDLAWGRRLHSAIARGRRRRRSSVVLETALVDMYAKCGAPDMAKAVFDEMPDRNVVTWSAMISGFAQNSRGEEALALFRTMLEDGGAMPNAVTLAAALSACAQTGNISAGKWIHAYIDRSGMEYTTSLKNSMADMYAKCGNIELACEIFEAITEKDVISWNVVIAGLAMHGRGELALEKFSQMEREGMKPDEITFIGVLSACSHAGLVEEGRRHYRNMRRVHGIIPKLEHDGCMVDMLCKAGKLEEAEEFIGEMAEEPGREVWGALLGGAAVFDELRRGERAAGRLLSGVEPDGAGVCVLLSNMLAGRRRWEDARRVRGFMEEREIRKTPGCSSIDVDGVVHEFFSGESQEQKLRVYTVREDDQK